VAALTTALFAFGYPVSILVILRWIPVVRERRTRWFWAHQAAVSAIVAGWVIEREWRSVAINGTWFVIATAWYSVAGLRSPDPASLDPMFRDPMFLDPMFLDEVLERAARRAPNERAIITESRTVTFRELDAAATAWAARLGEFSSPGDRVAILAENRIEYIEILYGAVRAGRIAAPLNHRLHPAEWTSLLQLCGAKVLIAEQPWLDRVLPLLADTAVEHVVDLDDRSVRSLAIHEPPAREFAASVARREPSDVAWLIATSGTTGLPKWAMLTHRSLLAGTTNLSLARPITDDDVLITPFPMCHVAVYNVLAFHRHARPVALMARFEPDGFNQLIERASARTLSLAPTMIATWLDAPSTATANRATVRTLGYGASAIPEPLLRRAVATLGVDLSQGYGMTELSGNAAFLDGDEHRLAAAGDERRARAAGRAGPLVSLKIVDDLGAEVPHGTEGEIWARGDQVCAGYWDDPDATAAAFDDDGWFRTGDLGRIDADGLLSVIDRKKDIVVTGGENVASREVEHVLEQHPGVREVAVIGIPDDIWGENVCAVVVPVDPEHPPTLEDLIAFSRERLAGFKKPKVLRIVADLPKNATGKIHKQLLRNPVDPEPDPG
jgi:acyl-CoA synthetase (AMP-forming)/AMP-acid ligase II